MDKIITALIAALVALVAVPAFPQRKGKDKPPPLEPLAYYDANGNFVGRYLSDYIAEHADTKPLHHVLLPYGSGVVAASIGAVNGQNDAWFAPSYYPVYFSGANCTGTPYLHPSGTQPPGINLTAAVQDTADGRILFIAPSQDWPPRIEVASRSVAGACAGGGLEHAVPAVAMINLTAEYPTTFTLK